MLRAKQTAEIICSDRAEVEICDHLREMVLGKLEGLTWQERNELYSDIDIEGGLSKVRAPGGESFEDIVSRCDDFIKSKLEPRVLEENILIVSHGITKRVLINLLLEKPSHYVDYINWADNTAVSEVYWTDKTLVRLNDRKHLTDLGLGNENYGEWGCFSKLKYAELK